MAITSEQLKLRAITSPYSDITVGSVLSHSDVDYNFINLKGMSLSGISSSVSGSVSTVVFTKFNGLEYTVEITGISSTALASAMTEAVLYTNPDPTLVPVGGVEVGSTFSAVTMQDMWTDILYPTLSPSFSNFYISGITASVDVGYTFSADDRTFVWTTPYPASAFIKTGTTYIYDAVSGVTLISGLTNDTITGGDEFVNIPYSITKTVRFDYTFRIYAQKLNNIWFNRPYYLYWSWRRFWGNSTNPELYLNTDGITGLTNNQLSRYVTGDFSFNAGNGYKYIILPKTSGWVNPNAQTNPYGYFSSPYVPHYIRDASTNLNIALAGASDGYTDVTSSGLPYKEVASIPNEHGYSDIYYVFRSKYQLGGAITIRID